MTHAHGPLITLSVLASSLAVPALGQEVVVSLETAAQCSAAFGVVAAAQERGAGTARTDYPPLAARGREFFVQTAARMMDEQGLTREEVRARLQQEVSKLQPMASNAEFRQQVMVPCLSLLDAAIPSQLPKPR